MFNNEFYRLCDELDKALKDVWEYTTEGRAPKVSKAPIVNFKLGTIGIIALEKAMIEMGKAATGAAHVIKKAGFNLQKDQREMGNE